MERHFEQELKDLKAKILYMGSVVERMMELSTKGLVQKVEEAFNDIWKLEEEINHLHIELDEKCIQLIALHQPAAADLRFIISTMKINQDLERIADQAINVTQNATIYFKEKQIIPAEILDKIVKMVEMVKEMLHNVLDSFVHKDIESAKSVLLKDAEVDRFKREIIEELIKSMIEKSELIKSAIELILIARNLERIGDHSTNIAENVIFSVAGKDVRHRFSEIVS